MTFDEALAHVFRGGRATCNLLPLNTVLKLEAGKPDARIVFELTGDGFDFQPNAEHKLVEWRKVEGWVSNDY